MKDGNYTRNLIISFTIIIFLLIVGVIYNFKLIDYFTKQSTNIYKHPYAVSNTIRDIKIKLFEIEIELRDVLIANKIHELTKVTTFIRSKEHSIMKDINTLNNRYLGNKNDIRNFENSLAKLTQTRLEIISLFRFGKTKDALKLKISFENKQLKEVEKTLEVIAVFAKNKGKSYFNKIQKTASFTFNITIIFAIIIVVFSIIISLYIIRTTKQKEEKIKRYFHMIEKNIFSLVFDTNGNILESSNALSLFLGSKKEDLLSKQIDIILYDEIKRKELFITITNGFDWEEEIEYENDIWLNVKVSPSLYSSNNIVTYSMILQDISDKKRIEHNSNIDQLTNLYNRRFFDDIVPKLLKQLKRSKEHSVFIMIDIDYFKQYNDFYGHPEGDVALKSVSRILSGNTNRANDYVFRLGGEEFGVFINCEDLEKAKAFIDKLRLAVMALEIDHNKSSVCKYLTISLGAIFIDSVDTLDMQDIYIKADNLLYKAKENGRNKSFIEII